MRYTTLLTLLLLSFAAFAQCPFTPTISPSDPVLCPNETATLGTQVYDSYQWYKDGALITGATAQTLTVEQFNDAGSSFTVMAEEDGCFEMSAAILVDGWVFLPPYVIHEGDEPLSIGPDGSSMYCEGDMVQLTLGMPYTEQITWTRNGQPIPGETGTTLVITTSGSYSVSAAPSVCPSSVAQLGVSVDITFMTPVQPAINEVDGQLCATPAGNIYQWYLNDVAILNSNTPCITPSGTGVYTVRVYYPIDCHVISGPYLITAMDELTDAPTWTIAPGPEQVTVNWDGASAVGTFWSIIDLQGRSVRNGFLPTTGPLNIAVGDLPDGVYLFQAAVGNKAMAPAQRFSLQR